jgi:hypothetical protein
MRQPSVLSHDCRGILCRENETSIALAEMEGRVAIKPIPVSKIMLLKSVSFL